MWRIAASLTRVALVGLCPLLLCLLSTSTATLAAATNWRRVGWQLWSVPALPAGLCCLAVLVLLLHSAALAGGGWPTSSRVVGESVLLAPGLGLQHSRLDFLGRPTESRFIPAQSVRDIILHEYVTLTRIFPLLTVVLCRSAEPQPDGLYQLFADCCLPLTVMADIYRQIQALGYYSSASLV